MLFTIDLDEETQIPAELALPSLTHAEFCEFCQRNPDLFVERSAEGKITLWTPADAITDSRNLEITVALGSWNRTLQQPGLYFGPSAGFTLPNGAVRSPDAAWVSAVRWERLAYEQKEGFALPMGRIF